MIGGDVVRLGVADTNVAAAREFLQQGYQIAFNEVFHMLGWVFIALVLVIWLAKPPFSAKAGPPAHCTERFRAGRWELHSLLRKVCC